MSQKILIIEDNPKLAEGVSQAALRENHIPKIASCGEEAREILKSNFNPDIVILDIMLPDVENGLDLVKDIRDHFADSCIIVWTAHGDDDEYLRRALEDELVHDFLTKGITQDRLIRHVIKESQKWKRFTTQRRNLEVARRNAEDANREAVRQKDRADNFAFALTCIRAHCHSLGNKLTSLRLGLDQARDGLDVQGFLESGHDLIRKIEKRIARFSRYKNLAEKIVDDLDFREVVIEARAEAIEEWQLENRHLIAKTPSPSFIQPEEPFLVECDPDLLTEVVIVLVSNALDSCGSINPCPIEIELTEDDGNVILAVRDRGAGFTPENLEKVQAGEHFTTKGRGGNGIGLLVTRRIAEQFGGRFDPKNREGGGAECIFQIQKQQKKP